MKKFFESYIRDANSILITRNIADEFFSTFNRVKDLDVIPQEVKLCEYKMINSIKGYIEASNSISANGNVASENTDGYSISYVTANQLSDVVKSMDTELNDIIRTYLLGVIVNGEHLMYCGVE